MSVGVGLFIAAVLAAAPATDANSTANAGAAQKPVVAAALSPDAPDAIALQPSHGILGSTLEALPPPPEAVSLTGYYGTVTVDHRAHLARRISCKKCHDPGPVGKIAFTPKVAHERCVECHRVEARGPTACTGCHVKPPPPPEPPVITAEPTPAAPAEPSPEAAAAAAVAAVTAPAEAEPETRRYRQSVDVGAAMGSAVGFSVRLSTRQELFALENSVDRLSGKDSLRTVVLVGGGITRPLRDRFELIAVGLGGIDAVQKPEAGLMPALGARVGVLFLPQRGFLNSVQLSVTGLVDVANRYAMGTEIGGTTIYATVATGFGLIR